MLFVEKSTRSRLVRKGERLGQATTFFTRQELCFEVSDLVCDPSGISTHCPGPGFGSVLALEARNGFYGFTRDGHTLLVHKDFVEVG